VAPPVTRRAAFDFHDGTSTKPYHREETLLRKKAILSKTSRGEYRTKLKRKAAPFHEERSLREGGKAYL